MGMTLLCYGDSNTYGYDPRSYLGERYPRSVRWTGLLAEAGYEVRNEGLNGRSIPRDSGIPAAVRLLLAAPFRLLTVQLGVNDLLNDPALTADGGISFRPAGGRSAPVPAGPAGGAPALRAGGLGAG